MKTDDGSGSFRVAAERAHQFPHLLLGIMLVALNPVGDFVGRAIFVTGSCLDAAGLQAQSTSEQLDVPWVRFVSKPRWGNPHNAIEEFEFFTVMAFDTETAA